MDTDLDTVGLSESAWCVCVEGGEGGCWELGLKEADFRQQQLEEENSGR